MTNERWEQFVETAKQAFEDVVVITEDLVDLKGEISSGTEDIVTFNIPAKGRFKVVRQNKPLLLEKKMHYSNRQGDTARTEYIFSETDFTHKVRVFQEDDYGEWDEIRAESLGL